MENLRSLQLKKHIHAFEHFTDIFEVEYDDVYMRSFSESLEWDAKEWFRNLKPDSISTSKDHRDIFLKFWGERKSWDQHLSRVSCHGETKG